MKYLFCLMLLAVSYGASIHKVMPEANTIGEGKQPQVSIDNSGTVRVVYGLADKIFCATSADHGQSFSKPVLVADVPEMHLGMSRGPQLSSSANYSIITAMDKAGNIHWFKQDHKSHRWISMGLINDLKGSAPEGLIGIASDKNDNFYAAWLDTRLGGKNQIWFSSLSGTSNRWSANRLAYQSPDLHVCECCKPNIAVNRNNIAIMFRNWLNGSRDLYVMRSVNSGKSFAPAQKLGLDTWKLNGCPMDGGGIRINASNIIETVWQRKGDIYFAKPGEPEMYIGNGKTCSMSANTKQALIAYQNKDTLKAVIIPGKKGATIGIGNFIKSVGVTDKSNFFVWEQGDQIKYRLL